MTNPRLADRIKERIRTEGVPGTPWSRAGGTEEGEILCIPFAAYMADCLYDKRDGYYRSGPVRIGRAGDFYTSPAIGDVMANVLASVLQEFVEGAGIPCRIAEWGAGTGRLAAGILSAWNARFPAWRESVQYIAVEDHPGHLAAARLAVTAAIGGENGPEGEAGKRAKGTGSGHGPVGSRSGTEGPSAFVSTSGRVRFLDSAAAMDEEDWSGEPALLLANELLDAFPVHRVIRQDGELMELGVAESDRSFRYAVLPLSDPGLLKQLELDGITLREGQITEVGLAACGWIRAMGERVPKGRMLLIDYGHDAAEYAAAHRMDGTLMCYASHRAADDPFASPGEQDLTAHVNFTSVLRAAREGGWRPLYSGTQKQFLVDHGVLGQLAGHDGHDPFSPAARRNRAVRQLLLSDGMSEAFKVLMLEKS